MDDTETQTDLRQILGGHSPHMKLVIGSKNYSSWSLRPWLLMKAFGISFEEIKIPLHQPESAGLIAEFSNAGRVPVLIAGDLTVWDSYSICEYLAEQFALLNLWPENVVARAMARSICAEMHSGFQSLRQDMPFNIRANFPGKGRSLGAQADIGRISEIFEECFALSGAQQYLFGDFTIADAYFAPVILRFQTYGVVLAPALEAYAQRILAHAAVQQWIREACVEPERIPQIDNYYEEP